MARQSFTAWLNKSKGRYPKDGSIAQHNLWYDIGMTNYITKPLLWAITLCITISLVMVGCNRDHHPAPTTQAATNNATNRGEAMQTTILKIKVMSDGSLILNGNNVTLPQLQERVTQCDPAKTVVWYYRENPDTPEPPPVAFKMLDIIMRQQLPISLSSKSDFSDFIDAKGASHPRR